MRVLHVTSNWKWTGPSEPMLRLMLAQRAAGFEVALACPEDPDGRVPNVAWCARAEGIETVCELDARRGTRWWRDRGEVGRLRALLEGRPFDVLHVWHHRDHVLAYRAAGAGREAGRVRIVRSYAHGDPIPRWPWNRLLFGRCTDGLLCVSERGARANRDLCAGAPVAGALGAVDLERFRPGRPEAAVRAGLGLEPDQKVVGIVARVQRHRRFELLLEAMARLARREPDARLLVVGRGTHLNAVARRPAVRLGIEDRVVFAGFRGADYPDVLRAMDLFTFLVPGSDGGCRALMEAQACGLPGVTSRRGALPEILVDGETGLLVDEEPQALCDAWHGLLAEPARRAAMGRAARRRAEEAFHPARLAEAVAALYREAGAPA